jgi:hypothetical protein
MGGDMSEPAVERPLGISREQMFMARRAAQEQFAAMPLAFSTDGRVFGYEAPLTHPAPAGGYVAIETAGGVTLLGQIIDKTVAEREGPTLEVELGNQLTLNVAGATVSSASFRPRIQYVTGNGRLLGKLVDGRLTETSRTDLFQDAPFAPAAPELVDLYLRGAELRSALLAVGPAIHGNEDSSVALQAAGFNRHSFLCGQSGSGKTYALGVILEQLLLETQLRLLVLDPNSDYVGLGRGRSADNVARQFGLPADDPWIARLLERYRALGPAIRVARPAGSAPATDRLTVRFNDLTRQEQALALLLNPLTDREEFSGFWRIVDQIGSSRFSINDVRAAAAASLAAEARQIGLRIENLGIAGWQVWSERDEPSLVDALDDDWRAMVVDIGRFELVEESAITALAVLGKLWRQREERQPILIVVDEAHNVCPQEPVTELQEAVTEYMIRIAGEGRKFGLYLLLATQRPDKLHINVLSQCDNLILMRMNSQSDVRQLAGVFSFVPPSLLEQAAYFLQGESLVAGRIASFPTLIRFRGRLSEEGGSDVATTWADQQPAG